MKARGARMPQSVRAVAALSIVGPPAFIMGLPLPTLLQHVKIQHGSRFVAVTFGVNGGASAFGTMLAFLVCMAVGFSQTFVAAALIYLVAAAGIFATIHKREETPLIA